VVTRVCGRKGVCDVCERESEGERARERGRGKESEGERARELVAWVCGRELWWLMWEGAGELVAIG